MKISKTLITGLATGLAIAMTASAENENKKDKRLGEKRSGGLSKMLIEKFDKDGDGKLNEAELAKAKKQMMERREANQAKMLKRFDTDKDGSLSKEEKKAAMPALAKERKEIHKAVLKQFDKDGDGTLSPDERNGVKEWVKENYPDAMHIGPGKGSRLGGKGLPGKKCKKGKKGPKGKKGAKPNADKKGPEVEKEEAPAE